MLKRVSVRSKFNNRNITIKSPSTYFICQVVSGYDLARVAPKYAKIKGLGINSFERMLNFT